MFKKIYSDEESEALELRRKADVLDAIKEAQKITNSLVDVWLKNRDKEKLIRGGNLIKERLSKKRELVLIEDWQELIDRIKNEDISVKEFISIYYEWRKAFSHFLLPYSPYKKYKDLLFQSAPDWADEYINFQEQLSDIFFRIIGNYSILVNLFFGRIKERETGKYFELRLEAIDLFLYYFRTYISLKLIKSEAGLALLQGLKYLIEGGIFCLVITKKYFIMVPAPKFEVDSNFRFHSLEKEAINWLGKKFYYLFGIEFPFEKWKAIKDKSLTKEELIKEKNIEKRMAMMKALGREWILERLDAIKVDESERGNVLYRISEGFPHPQYLLVYKDKSTDRVYYKFVDPNIFRPGEKLSADKAQAWSFSLKEEEYSWLKNES